MKKKEEKIGKLKTKSNFEKREEKVSKNKK